MMEICEFCSRKVKRTEGTSFSGLYCADCHLLNIRESQEAINIIKGRQVYKFRSSKSDEKEKEKEEALKNLLAGL